MSINLLRDLEEKPKVRFKTKRMLNSFEAFLNMFEKWDRLLKTYYLLLTWNLNANAAETSGTTKAAMNGMLVAPNVGRQSG